MFALPILQVGLVCCEIRVTLFPVSPSATPPNTTMARVFVFVVRDMYIFLGGMYTLIQDGGVCTIHLRWIVK